MAAYIPVSILLDDIAQVVGNSQTNKVVSVIRKIEAEDSRDMWIVAECSTVAGGAGVLKMQQCHRKDGTYTDVSGATVTVTAAGVFKIEWNTVDGAGDSLLPFIRIVSTTGAGDTLTVDRLYKTERLDA